MSEETPEKIRAVLDLELGENDSGEPTVRGYLLRLLADVWREQEGFDGKRPFGNSSWDYDIKTPMVRAGLVRGRLDSDGCIEDIDDAAADELVLAAIAALDAPRAGVSENAKTVVVDIRVGALIDRQAYAADGWKSDEHDGLTVTRDGRHVAEFAPGQWLSARTGDALVPDATARKLGIARKALREILAEIRDDPGSPDEVLSNIESLASDALDAIFAETE